jgi:hypothetical protein
MEHSTQTKQSKRGVFLWIVLANSILGILGAAYDLVVP